MINLKINSWTPIFYLLILFTGMHLNCNPSDKKADSDNNNIAEINLKKDSNEINSKQIIIAYSNNKKTHEGILFGVELVGETWKTTFDTISCTFGKNGFAEPDRKIEGDGKTPSGTFEIGSAFGYKNDLDVDMDFIELSDNQYWISDTNSQMYNKLVDYDPGDPFSEKMKRNDHLYKYGIIIEYNTKNTIKGKGSAIFIHIERKKGSPTTGCIAVSDTNIKNLIGWIKPGMNTTIIMGAVEFEYSKHLIDKYIGDE